MKERAPLDHERVCRGLWLPLTLCRFVHSSTCCIGWTFLRRVQDDSLDVLLQRLDPFGIAEIVHPKADLTFEACEITASARARNWSSDHLSLGCVCKSEGGDCHKQFDRIDMDHLHLLFDELLLLSLSNSSAREEVASYED